MISYQIESKFPSEESWHVVWTPPGNLTSIEELVKTLALYRKNHPDLVYRLLKIEVIG